MDEPVDSLHDETPGSGDTSEVWTIPSSLALVVFTSFAALVPGLAVAAVARLMPEGIARTLSIGFALSLGYCAVLGVAGLVARRGGVAFRDAVGWRPTSMQWLFAGSAAVALGGRIVAGVWGLALQSLGVELPGQDLDPTRLLPADPLGVIVLVMIACVLAPVTEEIVFRGVLLPTISAKWGHLWGNAVTSLVFSAVHVFLYAIPPIFVLSLGLGSLARRSGSITPSILAHSLFNLVALAGAYSLRFSGVA